MTLRSGGREGYEQARDEAAALCDRKARMLSGSTVRSEGMLDCAEQLAKSIRALSPPTDRAQDGPDYDPHWVWICQTLSWCRQNLKSERHRRIFDNKMRSGPAVPGARDHLNLE